MPVLDPSTIISTLKSKVHTELSPSYRGTLPQELRLPLLPYSANWSGSLVHGATSLGMKFLFSLPKMLPTNGSPIEASYSTASLQEAESVFQDDTVHFRPQSEIPKTSNDQFRGPRAKLLSLVTISSRSGIAVCQLTVSRAHSQSQ
jgi:hypothetical protein